MEPQLCVIGFDQYEITCIIGVNPEERIHSQVILVDLRVESEVSKGVISDSMSDTVDYVGLANICDYLAQNGNYFLLETYAHAVLEEVMKHPKVHWASIRVKKPQALPAANYTVVEMEKGRRQ